jgi:hypothetical protein
MNVIGFFLIRRDKSAGLMACRQNPAGLSGLPGYLRLDPVAGPIIGPVTAPVEQPPGRGIRRGNSPNPPRFAIEDLTSLAFWRTGRRIDKKTTPSYVSQRVRTVIATHACRCIIVLQKPE